MKKLGFVIPWYGDDIPGGAESALRGIASHLYKKGIDLEVLTTCVKEFKADWSTDYYKPGTDDTCMVPVRRFKVRKRDKAAFDKVNYRLMKGLPISREQEELFMREIVNSPDLYAYIKDHKDEYEYFIFIPYMFGPTYYGAMAAGDKAVMIPCLHEEGYAHMSVWQEIFPHLAGLIYLAEPEKELANRLYDIKDVKQEVLGTGIDTDMGPDAAAFRKKYKIEDPFILYAGRKTAGKNVDLLLKYFSEYKKRNKGSLKLVLIGGDTIAIPQDIKDDVIDLGFIDYADKFSAYGAASLLCQPSTHESFSIVIMESWLCERPVLVHGKCDVTKNFAINASGGLYFENYFEFEGCVNYLLAHPETADQMGRNGREFVLQNYAWDAITDRFMKFFEGLKGA